MVASFCGPGPNLESSRNMSIILDIEEMGDLDSNDDKCEWQM